MSDAHFSKYLQTNLPKICEVLEVASKTPKPSPSTSTITACISYLSSEPYQTRMKEEVLKVKEGVSKEMEESKRRMKEELVEEMEGVTLSRCW